MNIVHFGLPGTFEIETILNVIMGKTKKNRFMPKEEKDKIIRASLGLTETEIFNAYMKSMVSNDGKIIYSEILDEKKQIIKKDGTLEYQEADVTIGDIGGLKNLTDWIKKRKIAYNEDIRKQYNLSLPKGVLMTGIQGCGKSYTAKAIAQFLEVPLIRLDIGALMNKWVGQSEENIRKAITLAESISPCVLFIDEIDKVIPDPTSGGSHEVTKRILSTLLTWLQDKTSPVFVVATANNIHHLPPELMRKGRFDEIFFIDLPKDYERKEIFKIHLRKKGYEPENFDLARLVEKTEGFSGSEIEVLINEGIFQSAYERSKLNDKHLFDEIEKTSPLSVTMADKLKQIQDWADKNNVRPAS
jgi:SpoVK/Ycf46/Vps4 family AAA+-type ATPase